MKTIKINPADNVAVAIEPLQKGESIHIDGQNITLNDDVPAGHKILLSDLVEGENVIKYGYPIGHLKENHKQGDGFAMNISRRIFRVCWIMSINLLTRRN